MITDGKTHTGMDVEYAIERGILYRADTLEELAGLMGVDEATFLKTVDDYNEMTRTFNDPEFGRSSFGPNAPLDNPPFLWHHPAPGRCISRWTASRPTHLTARSMRPEMLYRDSTLWAKQLAAAAVSDRSAQAMRWRNQSTTSKNTRYDRSSPPLPGRAGKTADRFLNSNKLSADLSSKGFCRAIPHFHGEKEGTEMDNNGLVSRRGFLAGSAFAGAGALFGPCRMRPADCGSPSKHFA